MIVILIEQKNLQAVHSLFLENAVSEVFTSVLKKDYKVVTLTGRILEVQEKLIRHKISARFIFPYLSKRTFEESYGRRTISRYDLTPVYLDKSYFEEVISPMKGVFPQRETGFYLITDALKSTDLTVANLSQANAVLSSHNLLLDMWETKKSLKEILLECLETLVEKELSIQQMQIEDIERLNDEFFLSGIADFILTASKNHTKEEIKKFLIVEFELEEREG